MKKYRISWQSGNTYLGIKDLSTDANGRPIITPNNDDENLTLEEASDKLSNLAIKNPQFRFVIYEV